MKNRLKSNESKTKQNKRRLIKLIIRAIIRKHLQIKDAKKIGQKSKERESGKEGGRLRDKFEIGLSSRRHRAGSGAKVLPENAWQVIAPVSPSPNLFELCPDRKQARQHNRQKGEPMEWRKDQLRRWQLMSAQERRAREGEGKEAERWKRKRSRARLFWEMTERKKRKERERRMIGRRHGKSDVKVHPINLTTVAMEKTHTTKAFIHLYDCMREMWPEVSMRQCSIVIYCTKRGEQGWMFVVNWKESKRPKGTRLGRCETIFKTPGKCSTQYRVDFQPPESMKTTAVWSSKDRKTDRKWESDCRRWADLRRKLLGEKWLISRVSHEKDGSSQRSENVFSSTDEWHTHRKCKVYSNRKENKKKTREKQRAVKVWCHFSFQAMCRLREREKDEVDGQTTNEERNRRWKERVRVFNDENNGEGRGRLMNWSTERKKRKRSGKERKKFEDDQTWCEECQASLSSVKKCWQREKGRHSYTGGEREKTEFSFIDQILIKAFV